MAISMPAKVVNSRRVMMDLPANSVPPRRSVTKTLEPLNQLVGKCPSLLASKHGLFETAEGPMELPRYLFIGPRGGGEMIRIGIYAGIHGDEPEGVHALVRLLTLMEANPDLAKGYCIFAYPICNPTGFEDRTRHSRTGKDLNREFWRGSREGEVRLLESELVAHALHGIISLHTDDTSGGFYGYAHGATLTQNLIEPALTAAEAYLPRNNNAIIDGFPAQNGIIRDSFAGTLRAPPRVRPRPFEIILETPQAAPAYLKEAALVAALQAILVSYREFIAFAADL